MLFRLRETGVWEAQTPCMAELLHYSVKSGFPRLQETAFHVMIKTIKKRCGGDICINCCACGWEVTMSKYIIMTDTSADLPESYLAEHQIPVASLHYLLDGVQYGEEKKLDEKTFYRLMREGKMPTTNAVNPETVASLMEDKLKQELDILYIAFSSGLSSTYQNTCIAADEMREKYPDRTIIVIDSLCASLGQGLLVHKAVMMKEKGMPLDENAKKVRELIPHICHQFTVDDLHHLHRGGRVSKATAIVGTMMNIKPVMHVDDEGKLCATGTVRGRKKALNTLVSNMCKDIKGYEAEDDVIFISHGDCLEDAEYVADRVKAATGIQNFIINYVGPVIGAHSGPGTLALFFVGETR